MRPHMKVSPLQLWSRRIGTGLFPGLLGHRYDVIMAAMEINGEARQKSRSLSLTSACLPLHDPKAASQNHDTSPAGLKLVPIGVEFPVGTHEAYLDDVYKQSEIRPYATLE
jgi:polar amino acid transport system substrate-binding protein